MAFGFVCCDCDRYLSIVMCFAAACFFIEFGVAEAKGRFVYLFEWPKVFDRGKTNTFISNYNVCLTQDGQTWWEPWQKLRGADFMGVPVMNWPRCELEWDTAKNRVIMPYHVIVHRPMFYSKLLRWQCFGGKITHVQKTYGLEAEKKNIGTLVVSYIRCHPS